MRCGFADFHGQVWAFLVEAHLQSVDASFFSGSSFLGCECQRFNQRSLSFEFADVAHGVIALPVSARHGGDTLERARARFARGNGAAAFECGHTVSGKTG